MYWMDFYNGICIVGFYVLDYINLLINFSVSLFRLPRCGLPRPIYTPRAITPRAITPLLPLHGYHARVYIPAITLPV